MAPFSRLLLLLSKILPISTITQLRLLLWKSFKTAMRSPVYTIFEILLPLLVLNMLRLARNGGPHSISFSSQGVDLSMELHGGPEYYANNDIYACADSKCAQINETLKEICAKDGCNLYFRYPGGYADTRVLNTTALDMTIYGYRLFELEYLRKVTADDFHYVRHDRYDSEDRVIGSFVKHVSNVSTPITYNQLPSPNRQPRRGPTLLVVQEVVMLTSLLPMLAAINVAREIAVEKESSIKDYLLVMGMTRVTYYTHHLIWALIKSLPAILGASAMIIMDSPYLGYHFLLVFTLFVAAEISLATLIPAFIKRPTIATLCAFVLIPFNALLGVAMPVSRTSILLSSLAALNPGHAMALAFDTIREGLLRENTLYWFAEFNYVLTYGGLVIILVFDIVLYISFAILIDIIGNSKENIFARFKRAVTSDKDEEELELNIHEEDTSLDNAEVDVELIDVHKTYQSGEHAVKGVSMKLLRGQVTVLLGHNGAGKSTTFAMIAGITMPTAGTIKIGDASEKTDRSSLIGYCPQYNPIFPKLTVSEHLKFFAELKGNKTNIVEMAKLMDLLLLMEKANERAVNLSGGMKRKLSIAISLIGNTKVVLLDEPTAGVDAGARRDIERLLAEQKKERTFLLTTHYTDEAEHLGDRIMIMAGGKLVCSGSPHFLHKEFGAGYILSCVASDSNLLEDIAQETLKLAEEHVGNVKLERQHGQQFEIWLDKERSERFPLLFRALEKFGDELGIDSYGLSNNTLEQVFLRVGELTGITRQAKVKEALGVLLKENKNRSSGPVHYLRNVGYLQYKRILYEISELRSLLINLIPIVVFIYSIALVVNYVNNAGAIEVKHDDSTIDPLRIPHCMRIGIEQELDLSESLKESFASGSCIEIEETINPMEWYETTAMARRPPVLATIGRHEEKGGVLVRMAPNAVHYTSPVHLALVRALTNTSFSVTAKYMQPPQIIIDNLQYKFQQKPEEMKTALLLMTVGMFLLLQPILMYRFIGFYVVERTVKFTHQQLLTGLPRCFYWIASFFSDLTFFTLNFAFTIGCCFYFDVLTAELWRLTPLCYLIFIVSQVKCYILQRVFESKSKAENLAIVLLVISYISFASVYLYNQFNAGRPEDISFFNEYPLLLDPQLAVLAHFSEISLKSKWSVNSMMFAQFAIVLLIFVLLELGPILLQIVKRKASRSSQTCESTSAPLLENGNGNVPVLEVNNLVKKYGSNVAVRGISFGVEQHECFGLLGVNGAGKTSTFEVLTGSSTATSGVATVSGVDCATPARIGYCPQFDALMQQLSGRQNIIVLAALHGYRNPAIVADTVIECVGMTKHANKKSKSYSGGQRRKISVAAALLAQNSLIILDEPTAGIDPVTRRDIWSVICALRDSTETAIVLTSHSMEEVEALCSRIAILRKGEIAAQGSSQALKSAYGNNFKLTLVVDDKSIEVVQHAVHVAFPKGKRINGGSENTHLFEIPRDPRLPWSSMFSTAIELARALDAKDYCLSQASLEDAFIALNSGAEAIDDSEGMIGPEKGMKECQNGLENEQRRKGYDGRIQSMRDLDNNEAALELFLDTPCYGFTA